MASRLRPNHQQIESRDGDNRVFGQWLPRTNCAAIPHFRGRPGPRLYFVGNETIRRGRKGVLDGNDIWFEKDGGEHGGSY